MRTMFENKAEIRMGLPELVQKAGGAAEILGGDGVDVPSVEYDSRNVKRGSLFIAVEGFNSDGHRFIASAIENGASAVCVARDRARDFASLHQDGTGVLAADDTRTALSRLSAAFFGFPSRSMMVIGITGTNGKTSVTYMLEAILKQHGLIPGVIGTINYRWGGGTFHAPNNTPESRDLQELLWMMRRDGVDAVIMEVSSHALELKRADD